MRVSGDIGFDDGEIMREASSIEDSLFQTPAPIGDASSIAVADKSAAHDAEDQLANDGFGDEGLGMVSLAIGWSVLIINIIMEYYMYGSYSLQ